MNQVYNIKNKYLLENILNKDISFYFFKKRRLPIFSSEKICISKSKMKEAGSGILAKKNIEIGEILEINKYIQAQDDKNFRRYAYYNNQNPCISSGLGSFYCTAFQEEQSNINYLIIEHLDNHINANLIIIYASKKIYKNEELLYFYGKESARQIENQISPEVIVK